jgi:hypothetical protein
MQLEDRSRRELIKGLAASPFLAQRLLAAATDRPNILYLHSHDTGRYIEPYGYEVLTRKGAAASVAKASDLFRT